MWSGKGLAVLRFPGMVAPTQKRPRMKILDPNDPFFNKAWVRWATCMLPLLWGLVEFYFNSPGWGILFVVAGAYAFYMLILKPSDNG